ncbi:ArsR/SmtB family transcription factor [Dawidia soli]|uniref:ArsR family transcriptional regulator n=1 Tax=Dawidia soli TaxID=2782352 RepID=A0AAP2GFR5_9BACT|nr:metalloregulator ArsR/SmtB family transcription factor [Dawidia soli]MBT1689797.1 ArsR family transcriptional regulator [Dawidia soli]
MNKREFKDKVYGELATITKALANPHRLEIIDLLAQSDYSVEQISTQTGLSMANTSQHLQVLKTAQLVDVTRNGNYIHYKLADSNVFKAWKALRELGIERIATIDKIVKDFRQSKFKFESVTIDELVHKIASGKVTILDVRPEVEYRTGHIADSISIPFDELATRLKELPKRNEIIAYCRGPFCVFADEAVALLVKAGYKAKRLEEGFPDWHLMGLPVELN